MNVTRIFIAVILSILLSACSTGVKITKNDAYPAMYDATLRPKSIVVVPAINKSTAADATDFYNVTVSEQLSRIGYYVYPLEVVTDILRNEGVIDSEMIRELPANAFREGFGADAVLFITINSWDTHYMVISGSVEVDLDFVMYSTTTNQALWQYSAVAVINTSGNSGGGILADIIATAITTAMTKYVTVAEQANTQAFVALPVGPYHESHGTDGSEQVVNPDMVNRATQPTTD